MLPDCFATLAMTVRDINAGYAFLIVRFIKSPISEQPANMAKGTKKLPVLVYKELPSAAAKGAGINIRLSTLKLSEKFFMP